MPEIDGATGVLYLDTSGRVHRRLAWAEFRGGKPVPLSPPADANGSLRTIDDDGLEDPYGGQMWYEVIPER